VIETQISRTKIRAMTPRVYLVIWYSKQEYGTVGII